MVLGDSMSVLLDLEVDISDIGKLKKAQQAVERFENDVEQVSGASRQAARSLDEMASKGAVELKRLQISTGRASEEVSQLGDAARVAAVRFSAASKAIRAGLAKITAGARKAAASISAMTGSLQQAKMAMLGLMFTSLNMVFIFGGILALSPRIRAGLMMIVSALRLVAIEAGEMLFPHLKNLAEAIRNMDEDTRELVAKIAILGTAFATAGVLIGAFGQAFLTIIGIGSKLAGVIGTVAGAIGVSSSTIVIALGAVIGAVGLLAAAFKAGGGDLKKLLSTIMTKATPILNGLKRVFQDMAGEVIKLIGQMLETSGQFVSQFAGLISGVLRPVLKVMGARFIITINLIMNSIKALAKNAGALMEAVGDFAVKGANQFIDAWNKMVSKTVPILNSLIRKFNKLASKLPGLDPIGLIDEETVQAGKVFKETENMIDSVNKKLDEDLVTMADVLAGDEAASQVDKFNDIIDTAFSEENVAKVGRGLQNIGRDAQELGGQIKGRNVANRGAGQTENLFFPGRGSKKEVNVQNEVNMENEISEDVDINRLVDRLNEELERSNKRVSSTL